MRPSIDETMLQVAVALSRRSTCMKMGVGCVLTDERGRILAAGYNGVAAGRPHCNESAVRRVSETMRPGDGGAGAGTMTEYPHACPGASAPPGADLCEAVHCEQNALTWCRDPDAIRSCYVTVSPCMRCVKQLLNTGCARIVFLDEYAREPQAAALWRSAGRVWTRLGAAQPPPAAASSRPASWSKDRCLD